MPRVNSYKVCFYRRCNLCTSPNKWKFCSVFPFFTTSVVS